MRLFALAAALAVVAILVAGPAESAPPPVAAATPFSGAVWAMPPGKGPFPVIIVLGGSEGGTYTARTIAPLFAAQGYATLGLPYYNPGHDPTDKTDGLPKNFQDIPVDRLAQVRDWLARQPQADAHRIGVWGASKGAEFALIAASHYRWIRAVAAIVPSDVVWEGWGNGEPDHSSFSFAGKPLAFEPYDGMTAELAKAARGERMDMRRVHDAGRARYPERLAAARIPVENICAPLLVAGGDDDRIWPSYLMSEAITATRTKAGLPTIALLYPNAGHGLSGPNDTPGAKLVILGGQPAEIERARGEVWAATLKLFDDALKHPVRQRGTSARCR